MGVTNASVVQAPGGATPYMPYLDVATGTVLTVTYTSFQTQYLLNFDNSANQYGLECFKISWLNYINPDWKQALGASGITYGNLRGQGVAGVSDPAIRGVIATAYIDPGFSPVDFWYGSSNFGIYGVFGFGAFAPQEPTIFVNWPNWSAFTEHSVVGFSYALKNNVRMNVSAYPAGRATAVDLFGSLIYAPL